ncbi:ankyrin repeat domain-containing protein [Aequorivita echinoideorum]|uniref:Ankyrin repeat domain-containing protein n=1 Tax=Aequorivita echinoideorum TaxID=1549647 RepID=A0ABS5S0H0_9FLAO|nr:ankyrin repeat domain-containing protein [Aequorivita echinoideorum]MBT0606713.1 ankyrin repeat domain-containing protein [Aequorivita echinoideorum]
MKQSVVIFLFFISITVVAQQKNVLHDRTFWKENPDLETVKRKISEGNDATALNENGFDGTVYALLENANSEVIAYLVSLEGNPVDKRTHDSRIYLHWAAYAANPEMVQLLLEKGSSITALDSHGATPLTFAAGSGLTDTKIYDLFIANGVTLSEEKNEDGANTLLLAAPYLKDVNETDYFISKGISLNSTDNDGNGIFNYAAKRGNIDFLKSLVKRGVDYKTLNKTGGNAFLFAAQGTRGFENKIEVYEYLKSLGLKPNVVTKDGYTPLHRLAYGNSDKAIFEFFLEAGADVNQKDADGNTPFLNAASRNNLEMVQLLSKNVKDYNAKNEKGQTALLLAVQRNNPEVVEFLLQKGSNALVKDTSGNTVAYYLAASFNSKKPEEFQSKLKMLQQKGIKLNTIQADGNTLYHIAAKENNLALLKNLSAYEIPVNAVNSEGFTALHLAAMKAENDEMMKYLLANGADKNAKTDFEETAFDLASENEMLQKQKVELQFLK